MRAIILASLLPLILLLSCADEVGPWRKTLAGFLGAVGGDEPAGAAEYCTGDFDDLLPYVEPGVRPEIVGEAEESDGVRVAVRTPGRPGLTLVITGEDDAWAISVDRSLEATRAAALNAAFGAE